MSIYCHAHKNLVRQLLKQGLDWDWTGFTFERIVNTTHDFFIMQSTYHVILLVLLVLFLRVFQVLLTLALDIMNDANDDVVMESPKDFPYLNTISQC